MSAARNFYTASNPQCVLDKLQECRRALARMQQIERAGTDQEFLDSLGHFFGVLSRDLSKVLWCCRKAIWNGSHEGVESATEFPFTDWFSHRQSDPGNSRRWGHNLATIQRFGF